MLLSLLLLILAPGRQPAGALPKALLLLEPPWSTFFKGETVTLICKDHRLVAWESVSWYHNGNLLKRQPGELEIKKSGYYSCKTQRSSRSDPVYVGFLTDWLTLQASHPVFEGDPVVLRCRGKKEEDIMEKTYYRNGEEITSDGHYKSNITVYPPFDDDSYHCTASREYFWSERTETSKPVKIQVQELFPTPELTASPSQPIEGSPMTLKCETWLPPQTSRFRLQFCFFKERQALGFGWSNSPELHIPTVWSEDSASYWCQARATTSRIMKTSPGFQIHVQRVSVSGVSLETEPPVGQLIEGEDLVLICSAAEGTGTVTFSWHREGSVRSLGRVTQRALSAELRIASVREQDAGRYYCAADNTDGPILSKRVRITLRIPALPPVLTLRAPGAQAVEGDVVELRCEAQRGSPPILYQFYHENIPLGNSLAPSGGGASFNLSLTAEHSGNYSCEADNSLGVQRSEAVPLSVRVPVSHPVFTFKPAVAQAVVGDVVELRCEAQRGSPPILYWFYHENVILGNTSAPFGGGASFNLSLTTEHSGNYSCGADNGLGAQHSEAVSLSITGRSMNKVTQITVGVFGWLLSMLGLAAAAALVGHVRPQGRPEGVAAAGAPRGNPNEHQEPSWSGPSRTGPQWPMHSEPAALMELQPVYSNVIPGDDSLVYSQIRSGQHTEVCSPRTHKEAEEPAVIYSEVKMEHPDGPAGKDWKDAAEGYENVPGISLALDH
ncbi:Fc receptor-like protein 3 isoform X1 [Suricata suricatta]|uniref:Fc receptor like 3 n=2 Tax=Suricata suricatta TaxID=37032 RepID=A0A673U5C1_SURSU|nr:Fc receptor-like protein 3 isoform X1 [Suricata suricatta]